MVFSGCIKSQYIRYLLTFIYGFLNWCQGFSKRIRHIIHIEFDNLEDHVSTHSHCKCINSHLFLLIMLHSPCKTQVNEFAETFIAFFKSILLEVLLHANLHLLHLHALSEGDDMTEMFHEGALGSLWGDAHGEVLAYIQCPFKFLFHFVLYFLFLGTSP